MSPLPWAMVAFTLPYISKLIFRNFPFPFPFFGIIMQKTFATSILIWVSWLNTNQLTYWDIQRSSALIFVFHEMRLNPWLDWAHALWHFPCTAADTWGIEMQHPAVIRGWNWWQKIYSSSHLCHLAWALQSCFLIRLWDFSGIFMCKLNITVFGKWIGQLGEGFAYLAVQMLTLIKSGNNMDYFNKDTWTQKGLSTTVSV